MAELDEGAAAVAWMQLDGMTGRMVDHIGRAHAHARRMMRALVWIITTKDRHVAAATSGLFDEAFGGGTGRDWCNHFEQNRIDRQQRVLQAIFRDVWIAVADLEAHDISEVRDLGLETRRHQTDLPQSRVAGHVQ